MRNALKKIFKTINYVPFPGCNIEANLATQFTEHALNQIVDALITNGVVPFPCKPGDTLWIINSYANSRLEIINRTVEPVEIETIAINKEEGVEIETAWSIYYPEHFGESIFFTKEEAEQKLEEIKNEQR